MNERAIALMGGESVYCINENQLREAFRLAEEESEAGARVRTMIEKLKGEMNRNGRAALAFVLIDRLLRSAAPSGPAPARAPQP